MQDLFNEVTHQAAFTWLSQPDNKGALAIIIATEGPAYRPVGAIMAIGQDGTVIGSLSSGCIEADIINQAKDVLREGQGRQLRYGTGSPFFDLQLPCGGGMTVYLLPEPDRDVLQMVLTQNTARRDCWLWIGLENKQLILETARQSREDSNPNWFRLYCPPELRFLVIGKGAEVRYFSALARAAAYEVEVWSPENDTLSTAQTAGCITRQLILPDSWKPADIDPWTAITLFFHDHDWEPAILKQALKSPAFFIGTQGSKKAHQSRINALKATGVDDDAIARLVAPIGVIPSTRDPRSLAISVLADVCGRARNNLQTANNIAADQPVPQEHAKTISLG